MARLGAKERAQLPDSAFAYIDSQGSRRLPIHDPPHVRNALARFGQVAFEDEAARDRARSRLLRAAKKHGIMPIGFISAQLQPQRRLPTGQVTFLLTDIEGSTELLGRLDDRVIFRVHGDQLRRGALERRQRLARSVLPPRFGQEPARLVACGGKHAITPCADAPAAAAAAPREPALPAALASWRCIRTGPR